MNGLRIVPIFIFMKSFDIDKINEKVSEMIDCFNGDNKGLHEKFVRLEEELKRYYEQ